MGWAVHVRANTTVGTVGATATLLGGVDLDVTDDQVVRVQVLELGIALCIPEQVQNNLGGLHWPAALTHLEGLGLSRAANAACVLAERHALLLLANILQVGLAGSSTPLICKVHISA